MSHCAHEDFDATVGVARLTGAEGGPVTGFNAEIRIKCRGCGAAFEFLGVEPGVDTHGARVSLDGQELRIAITPPGERPNPLQRITANVSSFNA